MTNAKARFNKSLRPRKPEGSLGRTAQDVHLDSHTAPELWFLNWLIDGAFLVHGKNEFQVGAILLLKANFMVLSFSKMYV